MSKRQAESTIPKPLQDLAVFIGAFFSGLSFLVSALPFLDWIPDAIQYVPEPVEFSRFGPAVVCIAIVGQGYLRSKAGHKTIYGTGVSWVFTGIILALIYIFVGLDGEFKPRLTGGNGILMLLYLCIYGMLAKGFWEMGLFAYAADKKIKPVIAAPPQSLPATLAEWWKARKRARDRRSRAKRAGQLSTLQIRIADLEQDLQQLATEKATTEAEKSALEAEKVALEEQVARNDINAASMLKRQRMWKRIRRAASLIIGIAIVAFLIYMAPNL